MLSSLPVADEEYMTRCQNTMRQKYGELVYILITQKADPARFPNGAWFDEYLNKPLKVAGIDEDNNPELYILPGGNSIPFSCAELLTWVPPDIRSTEISALVNEIYCTKRLATHKEILQLLRLAFLRLPDDTELVVSQASPFFFADGTIVWLEEHRYHVDEYVVIFVAGVREVKEGKFCVIALDSGKGSCITLLKTAC